MRGLSEIKNQDFKNMEKERRWMKYNENYERRDDDSTNSTLKVHKLETGEVRIEIYDWNTGECMGAGFADYVGGGRSPKVRHAAENLALAIEDENKEHPIEERHDVSQEQFFKNRLILNKQRRKREKF